MKTDLSIVVPCFNYGKYIEECVGSIFANKTDLTYDVTIVDDCSTDDTEKICKELFSDIPEVKYIRNECNFKLPKSRNIGIENSDSDYIICLDADDALPRNYIQENYNTLKQNNVDVSYNDSQCFGTNQKLYNWPIDPMVMKQYPFVHCASMFKREIWKDIGGYDMTLIYGFEDYDFWLRALKKGYKFQKCENTYLLYRHTYNNMSNFIDKSKLLDEFKIRHEGFYTGYKS
jgi:glycosyltransferase involved in cell wall biosynthesis